MDRIKQRYKEFEHDTKDFLRTLNIILPKGRKGVCSLRELIQLHTYLNSSETVASGVRSDLVREYLAIVNKVRILTNDIHVYIQSEMTTYETDEYQQEANCVFVNCLISDVLEMLGVEHVFVEDFGAVDRKIISSERAFSGLLCYVPLLIAKLSTILTNLP